MRLKLYILQAALMFSLLSMLSVSSTQAQSSYIITSDQGLSSTCIRMLYEDSYRNVWAVTRNGLNRLSGSQITVYRHILNDDHSLLNNVLTSLTEIEPGQILVGTDIGLCIYRYASNDFERVPMINENGDTIKVHVNGITRLHDGNIHATVSGYSSFELKKNKDGSHEARKVSTFAFNNKNPLDMCVTKKGQVWIVNSAYQAGYFQGGQLTQVPGMKETRHIIEGINGDIYACDNTGGMFRYNQETKKFEHLNIPVLPDDTFIKRIRPNGKGIIYICTDGNGLLLYDERTGSSRQSTVRTLEFSLAASNVEDALLDSNGNLWIGVYWKGLVVSPHITTPFHYVGRRSALKNTIGTNCVTALLQAPDGGIFLGTDHCGLYHVNADGTQSTHDRPGEVPNVPSTITAIHQDKHGTLWLGSSVTGVACKLPNGNIIPFSSIEPGAKDILHVMCIRGDSKNGVWMAENGKGIYRYDTETHEIAHYAGLSNTNVPESNRVLDNEWVSEIHIANNRIFTGAASGMNVLTMTENGGLKRDQLLLEQKNITSIKTAPDGSLWVGTSEGVYRFNGNGAQFVESLHLSESNGLAESMIHAIEIYVTSGSDYEVWISTDDGINRYLPQTQEIHHYNISDGLQGNEFTDRTSLQLGGNIFFGGINGLTFFNPAEVRNSEASTDIGLRIVGVNLFGKPLAAGDKSGAYTAYDTWIDLAEEIHLDHNSTTISFDLASTGIIGNNVSYEYSLNGEVWIPAGDKTSRVVVSNLSSGTHTIHFRAHAGGKTSQERLLKVIVHPAWYASTGAKVIYILLFLLLAYFAFVYMRDKQQTRQILRRHHQEQEISEARMQFFMNISHEIRTPMTLILAPLEKLRSLGDDQTHQRSYDLIYQNAQRILRLINQMLDVRKIEKGQFELEPTRVELVSFIQNLVNVFTESAAKRGIAFDYIHADDAMDVRIDAPSIDKIVMNLLSNSFKFTPDNGTVSIALSTAHDNSDNFVLSVTDSGIGIPDEDKTKVFKRFYSKNMNGNMGTGIGLNLCSLLTELMGGSIRVEDNPKGHGTRFIVTLPKTSTITNTISQERNAERDEQLNGENAALAPDIDLTTQKQHGLRRRNMLLIEDEADIRQYLRAELSADFTVTEFSDGKEAWEYLQRNPQKADIIVSDIMMPIMDGMELCRKVKGNYNTSHIPVILLTAKTSDTDRIAGMSIGADSYLTKPFNVEVLRTTALTILQNNQALQGKFKSSVQTEQQIDQIDLISPDEQLMNRVMKCINSNINNPELSVEFVADKVGVSRVHFHRKIKELTGQTPRDYIKNIRLQQAARLLREKHLDITDVSIATGFKSLSTFSTAFKSLFGMSPSEYMTKKKE